MSMLKLLSNGQTLMGAGGRANNYKLPAKAALPKFAPMPRPLTLSPTTTTERVIMQPSLFDPPQAPVSAPAPVTPAATASPVASNGLGISPWRKMGEMGKAFVRQVFLSQKQRPTRAAAVQTELALSKVTPLRNDLSETDLEVYAPKLVRTATNTTPRKTEVAGVAWSRIANRFATRENRPENATAKI